jgi:hypothetical protein
MAFVAFNFGADSCAITLDDSVPRWRRVIDSSWPDQLSDTEALPGHGFCLYVSTKDEI